MAKRCFAKCTLRVMLAGGTFYTVLNYVCTMSSITSGVNVNAYLGQAGHQVPFGKVAVPVQVKPSVEHPSKARAPGDACPRPRHIHSRVTWPPAPSLGPRHSAPRTAPFTAPRIVDGSAVREGFAAAEGVFVLGIEVFPPDILLFGRG